MSCPDRQPQSPCIGCMEVQDDRDMVRTERGLLCLFCFTDGQEELEYNELDHDWVVEEILEDYDNEPDSGRIPENAEEGD